MTGAASGIGKAISALFAREGATVALLDLDDHLGMAVAEDLRADGLKAGFHHVDVTNQAQVRETLQSIAASAGSLDVLVNNAGTSFRGTIEDIDLDMWRRAFEVNATSVFLGCKYAIPIMKGQPDGGVIVNVASGAGLIGVPNNAAYCASKGAAIQLTRQLAVEYASHNIRVNAICPMEVDTPLMQRRFEATGDAAQARAEFAGRSPIGRLLQPDEVARVALFLATDGLPYAPVPYFV